MDSLAAAGIVLESFYSAPTCTPSRAMLMTGRYNIRTGMQDSVLHSTEPRGVPLDERFLPQKLAEAGYRTAGVGLSKTTNERRTRFSGTNEKGKN